MNIFKKAYARCFEGVFKLALPILPYNSAEWAEAVWARTTAKRVLKLFLIIRA